MLSSRYRMLMISIILILTTLLAAMSFAWFVLVNRTDSFIATAAKVDVSFQIYLDGLMIQPDFYVLASDQSTIKSGVYYINVSDVDADNYISNLRINIIVRSTVDTYVRVALIDSLTLATLDYQGNRGEVAIVDQPINYATSRAWLVNGVLYNSILEAEIELGGITSNDEVEVVHHWYKNILNDGYYYYPMKIERSTFDAPLVIPFIEEYDGDSFKVKSLGYQLQLAILVEGIQAAHNAPVYNWKLNTPPWGGDWS